MKNCKEHVYKIYTSNIEIGAFNFILYITAYELTTIKHFCTPDVQ